MSDLYHVHFSVNGEVADASFEFKSNAIALAETLDKAGYDPHVTDEFTRDENGYPKTIWRPDDE